MDYKMSKEYEDGRLARSNLIPATSCPYCFINTPCYSTKDYRLFDAEYRPLMNAWMKGWIERNKELSK